MATAGTVQNVAALFSLVHKVDLSVGVAFGARLSQGPCSMSHLQCGACQQRVSWEFVASPVAIQSGKFGLV